jgi:hypothetical protein
MRSAGIPKVGNGAFATMIANSLAAAPCALMVGTKTSFPIGGGCTLLVQPIVTLPSKTSTRGAANYGIPIPNNTYLLGADLSFTGVVLDPGGKAFGAAGVADGIEITIGK